jgi:hypothetical protein
LLWRNLEREESRGDVIHGQTAEETFATKIVVLPDAPTPAETPLAASPSGITVPEANEIDFSTMDVKRPRPPDVIPPPAAHEQQQPGTAPSRTPGAADTARPAGRFRVSFTAAVEQRRVAPAASRAAFSKRGASTAVADYRAPQRPPGNAEKEKPKTAPRHERALSAPASAVAVAGWESFAPAAATDAPRPAPGAVRPDLARAKAPDTASSFDLVCQPAPIESLLDEFCERLDEAAADLGILEEV